MKKKTSRHKYLAGHQRSWIWGCHAVTEILDAARWSMLDLYLADDLPPEKLEKCTWQGAQLGAAVTLVDRKRLRELCGASDHQGFLARMGPFPYATWAEVEEMQKTVTAPPRYLVLDAMRDAHNFGAIIRSAAALQATAIIVGAMDQAPVNNHVARASAGAVNRIPIMQVASLVKTMRDLAEQGVACVAAEPNGSVPVWSYDFKQPTAVVLGNESAGIRNDILDLCTVHIVIPGNSLLDSLNVAAANAAILYEALRQNHVGVG